MLWVRCSCEIAAMMYFMPVIPGAKAEPSATATNLIMDINSASFGLITGVNAKSSLHRQFQAQLRFNF